MDAKRRYSELIRRRLESQYGRPVNDHPDDPLVALIQTILSQNTTDITSEQAWKALRRKYRSWKSLANAELTDLAETIRVGGLAQIKARRIIDALSEIERLTGRLSLNFLQELSAEEADSWLRQLKGVGPKTRAIVLLFSLNMNAFPVDTHVFRVTKRLGLISDKSDRENAQAEMASMSKSEDYFSYHINLIEHGRKICSARRPKCHDCMLSNRCPWPEKGKYDGKSIEK